MESIVKEGITEVSSKKCNLIYEVVSQVSFDKLSNTESGF